MELCSLFSHSSIFLSVRHPIVARRSKQNGKKRGGVIFFKTKTTVHDPPSDPRHERHSQTISQASRHFPSAVHASPRHWQGALWQRAFSQQKSQQQQQQLLPT